ncbi:putative phosphoesterase [Histomonas meleagridis]|uniref:putative phosphoesterase n=1 Tax=Histomonas meleagridis TaxID=135588 RepID=UPI00355A8251|nr:putative phosphoesterase [Histomonas meleagridis]KAH0801892.1 putative phosphoesterase [Histomonas meleagridis]
METAKRLEEMMNVPVYYVPGNHDLWCRNFEKEHTSTDDIYQKFVTDQRCLCGNPILLQGKTSTYALIGDVGWFDYSFGNPEFTKTDFDAMTYQKRRWQDSILNQWTKDNPGKCSEMLTRIESFLQKYASYPQIVVTHMLPIREFCVPEIRESWRYFNAFLGSEQFGELYKKYPVKYAVCGHVHYRKVVKKDDITYICPCLNYANQWQNVDTPETPFERVRKQIEESIVTIEI